MEKYIKANTILKFINSCLEHEDKITNIEKAVLIGVKTCVERLPAVDVVEVVRCRECVFGNMPCAMSRYPDYFCADGKRKDEGQKNGMDISI